MGALIGSWLQKKMVFMVVSIVILIIFSATAAKAVSVKFLTWEVEYKRWSPDGKESVVMTINGEFPGPTIQAQVGDTIIVDLTNKLHTEGVVIHWHGIRQKETPWADGTASISQCAINPGETFVYNFTVDRAGTYFYHGHYGMQRSAGLYGLLIVEGRGEKEKLKYDEERNILLTDWWHMGSHQQEVFLSSKPMRWIGEPQTLLINGRGQFNCSLAAHYSDSSEDYPCELKGGEQHAPSILHVLPGKTYRLRIASSTALAALNLAIGNHKMTVVEADGNYVEPFTVDNMDIYSGDSYSILFTTNQDPTHNYWISVGVRGREPHTPPALTLLNYFPNSASQLPLTPPPPTPRWNDYAYSKAFSAKILAAAGSPTPPQTHARRITLLNTQNCIGGKKKDCSDGHTKWAINNISLTLPPTPYLGAIKYGLTQAFDQRSPPDGYPSDYNIMVPPQYRSTTTGNGLYTLELGSTVDVVLQNANALTEGVSEIHPWHLHGHDFWVLGYGEGKFEEADVAGLNLKNPPLRNTAILYPHGWTALRFVADNPGVWAFHCHIEPHLHMGMGVIFAEGVNSLPEIPNEALACGFTAKYLMNNTRT